MKKIMIAAAIVCAAVMSQAASLDWASYAYLNDGEGEGDWYTGGQGYLVLVTDASNFAVADDLTITGGTIVDNNSYSEGTVSSFIDGSKFSAADGQTYLFAVLATDKGSGATVPTTGLYGIDDNEGAFYSVTWNKDTGGVFSANENSAASVSMQVAPEPTSGLLLLLGMAGLALKRKRA